MLRLAAARLLWSVPLLFVVSALTFVLAALTPGDAARTILGTNTDPAAYEQIRAELRLDRPLLTQYADWLRGALQGDLGSSVFTGEPVTQVLGSRIEVSLSLIIGAGLACAVLGVALGLLSAVRGGALARLVDAASIALMSTPVPWLGLLLVLLFAIRLGTVPATGYTPFLVAPATWLSSLLLPVACLAAGGVALIARQTRGAVLDVLGRDHVRALRAAGLPVRSVLLKHVLRGAAVPVVTTLGLLVVGLLGGSIVVEQLFALPGLGQVAVTATGKHDLPVLQGVVVTFTLLVVVINLLTDIVVGLLDPAVRQS